MSQDAPAPPMVQVAKRPSWTKEPSLVEHVNAVAHAIGDVNPSVMGDPHRVHGIVPLLQRLGFGQIHGSVDGIVGDVAERAPVALVLARVRVKNDHPSVEIAVGDIDFVSLGVHGDVRRTAQMAGIVTTHRGLPFADPQQPLTLGRELQHHMIAHAIAADPHVILIVHEDTVLG